MRMNSWLKLSHHKHSGKIRPHEYTSYGPLALLLLAVGLALLGATVSAATPYDGPESGSIGLSGTMPGPAPTVAATITSPEQNQHFTNTPISVSGTCPKDTLVEIYKNDIFAGSVECASGGTYSFQIDLLIGKNVLIARVYDALNQAGPDSSSVTVFYDALPAQSASIKPLSFGGSQLLLNTDAVYRGVFPEKLLNVPIDILGGVPPYAVNVQWGDSTNKVISRNDNQTFNASHTYHKAGTYQISIQASDSQGRVAFLSVAAIVNGQPAVVPATTSTKATVNKLLVLWPLYTTAATIVISFWLGERREKHILIAHPQLLQPQA
jgi:hypothetical protein